MRLLAETVSLVARLPKKYCIVAVSILMRVIFFFYELTLTSAIIQAGLALPMAVYFHRVSISGLSANAVIVPLLGVALPVGFVAVFTGWSVPARIAGWLLAASRSAAEWHAGWEPNWRIPGPPVLAGDCHCWSADCGRASRPIPCRALLAYFTRRGGDQSRGAHSAHDWHPFHRRLFGGRWR